MLTTLPALLLTRTVNCDPLSETAVNAVVYREEVAQMMGEPFLFHWYVIGAVPVVATEKFADCPAVTD